MAEAKKTNYGNESISSLKGADRVRKRPGVIFGSDGLEGCEHAVFEILSNSIDEAREALREQAPELFETVGNMAFRNDLSLWEQAGQRLTRGGAVDRAVREMRKRATGDILNLTRTMGFSFPTGSVPARRAFTAALNSALTQTVSGTVSYQQACANAVRLLTQSGLRHIDYKNGVKPRQIEFARLNLTHTVMSKRHLRSLVERGIVDGWDDPRMPTLCGLRRRGYTAESILDFIGRIGVSKANSLVDIRLLESCIREELNGKAPRRICVAHPVKVVIDNYPADKTEYFTLPNNPNDPDAGSREVPFTKTLYIDAEDFSEVPPPKFFRLKPEGEVRLMGAYIVKCGEIVKNPDGTVKEIHCTADLETGNGTPADGRKIKGTIHWLSAEYAVDTTLVLYDHLFTLENVADMPEGKTYDDYISPDSAVRIDHAKLEPAAAGARAGEKFQFVRTGYFAVDTKNPNTFNRIVGLKDGYKA